MHNVTLQTAIINHSFSHPKYVLDNEARKKSFGLYEHAGTGFLKYSNLFNAFEQLGLDPPKEEVDELVSTYATQVKTNNNGTGCIRDLNSTMEAFNR